MPLPLPEYLRNSINEDMPNLSLRYYKRADIYTNDFSGIDSKKKKNSPPPKKERFFNSFIGLSKKKEYKQAFETRKRLMEGIGLCFSMTTETRLVFGMGYNHPTEIGFMFDWTTGLPIIPGSSLKGVARHAAITDEHECINEIFGPENKDGVKSGEIIFFPAYPCIEEKKPFLELDVMTPHYSEYYSDPANPPADWYSPVPLHFLTVPEGVKYCFRLAHRKNLKDKESGLLKKAVNILKCALENYGAGAKTAVSYGYFK